MVAAIFIFGLISILGYLLLAGLVGTIAGYVTGTEHDGSVQDLERDILIGVVGFIVGNWIINVIDSDINSIIAGILGSIVVIYVYRFFNPTIETETE